MRRQTHKYRCLVCQHRQQFLEASQAPTGERKSMPRQCNDVAYLPDSVVGRRSGSHVLHLRESLNHVLHSEYHLFRTVPANCRMTNIAVWAVKTKMCTRTNVLR